MTKNLLHRVCPRTIKKERYRSIGDVMKKLGLFVLLAFALAAGFAQTQFIAVYDFCLGDGNVQSFVYNGDPVTGISMGNMVKEGVVTAPAHPRSFDAVGWPLVDGPNPGLDPNKYMGFTMTAETGYTFSVEKVYFGIGRYTDGIAKAEWKGSADGYTDSFQDYTLGHSLGNWEDPKVLIVNDYHIHMGSSDNILNLANEASYQNIASCGFRMYMYESESADGRSGLWDRVMVVGTVQSQGGPALSASPTTITGLTYEWSYGPSTQKSFTVNSSGLTGPIHVYGTKNFEVATSSSGPYNPAVEIPGNGQQSVYVRLKEGLEHGYYNREVIMMHSSTAGYAFGAICSGEVDVVTNGYEVNFERPGEVKPLYDKGTVTLSTIEWDMTNAMIETNTNYVISGTRSAVLRGYGDSSMTMLGDYDEGCGEVSFWYRSYGTESQVSWELQYSLDEGVSWTKAGNAFTAPNNNTRQYFRAHINKTGPIRYRFIREVPDTGTTEHRLIIDDFKTQRMHDFGNFDTNIETEYGFHTLHGYSDASYTRGAIPSQIPNPNFTVTLHICITLYGPGNWGFTIVTNPHPDGWVAYKQGNAWYAFPIPDGYIEMPIYATRSSDVEIVLGYGNDPITVPVTLSHFSATMTAENYVQLTWISQTETNVLGYNVYRSSDNNLNTAMQICPMIAATNTSEAQTYIHMDQDLVEDGTYYYWLQNVDMDGTSAFHGPASVIFSITGDEGSPAIPKVTRLENAYPNPFNPNTTLRYQLESPGNVKIDIYNTRGQIVRSFEQGHDAAGYYGILWDGCDSNGRALASGVYLYRMTSGNYVGTKKVVLQK